MEIKYYIIIDVQTSKSYLKKFNAFKNIYLGNQESIPNQYLFNKKDINDAIQVAKDYKLKHRVHYQVIPNHLSEFDAYKLTMPMLIDRQINSNKFDIGIHQNTFEIVLSKDLKELFDLICQNIKWNTHDDKYILSDSESVNKVIIVDEPQIIFKNRIPKNTFTVIGNGIEIIDKGDVENLNKVNILNYESVEASNKVMAVNKTFVISSKLRQELSKNNILSSFIYPLVSSDKKEQIELLKI